MSRIARWRKAGPNRLPIVQCTLAEHRREIGVHDLIRSSYPLVVTALVRRGYREIVSGRHEHGGAGREVLVLRHRFSRHRVFYPAIRTVVMHGFTNCDYGCKWQIDTRIIGLTNVGKLPGDL